LRPRAFHIQRLLRPDFGVDLGTACTRIVAPGAGILLEEPTLVAVRRGSRSVLGGGDAVGYMAKVMQGRAPESIQTIVPVRRGVVADVEVAQALLDTLLRKARPRSWSLKPRVLVAVPADITPVERQATLVTVGRAGASRVFVVAKLLAAGLGAGLPLNQPVASLICDIGAGSTEIAVLSMGEIAVTESVRVAGDDLTRAVADHLRRRHKLHVGDQMAERIKIEIGAAATLDGELTMDVSGRDAVSGMPRKMPLSSAEVIDALRDPLRTIVDAVERTLERCPPELAADLMENGMLLCGGSAQVRGLDRRLAESTGMPVRVAQEPTTCVARGLAICLEHLEIWHTLIQSRVAA